jgi:streptomycin 6-kinase
LATGRLPIQILGGGSEGLGSKSARRLECHRSARERRLIDAATQFLDDLPRTQGEQVLVHQDLHGDNILAGDREPWLAIDPKPLAAEREFSLAPIIRSFEFGHSVAQVIYRLDRLSAELQLDRDRVRQWTIAQSVAWGFDSTYADRHFETARWLLAAP